MLGEDKYERVREHLNVCQKVWEDVYDDAPEVDDWIANITHFEGEIHISLKHLKDALEILNEELLSKKKRKQ